MAVERPFIAVLGLLLVGCDGLSSEEQASLLADVDQAIAESARMNEARHEGIREAAAQPKAEPRACPDEVKILDTSGNEKREHLVVFEGQYNVTAGTLDELVAEPGFRHARVGRTLDSLRLSIPELSKDRLQSSKARAARLADPSQHMRHEIVVAYLDVRRDQEYKGVPLITQVRARGLVWDHETETVVCQAETTKRIPGSIDVYYRADDGMTERDIEIAGERLLTEARDEVLVALGLIGETT